MRLTPFFYEAFPQYRRALDKYEIRKVGRWGPRWLHRLVWRVAVNLGMVGNWVDETTVVRRVGDPPEDVIKSIDRQIMQRIRDGEKDLVIYCGQGDFHLAASQQSFQGEYTFTHWSGSSDTHIFRHRYGFPLVVVPGLDGHAVLPRVK
jgi:hypothetical protein